jgi:hypothetical protein
MDEERKPKIDEILEALSVDGCKRALTISEYPYVKSMFFEVYFEEELRGAILRAKVYIPAHKATLYYSKDPSLMVLVSKRGCYYVSD